VFKGQVDADNAQERLADKKRASTKALRFEALKNEPVFLHEAAYAVVRIVVDYASDTPES
jgi:hypothetical protein